MDSWWWASQIAPKHSKWMLENLASMDCKVKKVMGLIEPEENSYARRAEISYKDRQELIKFVEEFHASYSVLAQRYDDATGVIRQAHRFSSTADAEIRELKESLAKLEGERQSSLEQISLMDIAHEEAKMKELQTNEKISLLEQSLSEMAVELENARARADVLEGENATVVAELEALRVTSKHLEKQLQFSSNADTEIRKLKESLAMLEGERESSLERISLLDIAEEDAKIKELQAYEKNSLLEKSLLQMAVELENARARAKVLEVDNATVIAELESVRVTAEHLVEQREEIARENLLLQKELKMGLFQLCKALEIDVCGSWNGIDLGHLGKVILERIDRIIFSLFRARNENEKLEKEKYILVREVNLREDMFVAQINILKGQLLDMQLFCKNLLAEKGQILHEKRSLLERVLYLEKEKQELETQNCQLDVEVRRRMIGTTVEDNRCEVCRGKLVKATATTKLNESCIWTRFRLGQSELGR